MQREDSGAQQDLLETGKKGGRNIHERDLYRTGRG